MKICNFQLDIWPGPYTQRIFFASAVAAFFLLQVGCAADSAFEGAQEVLSDNNDGLGDNPTPPDNTIPPPDFSFEKLAWEDGNSDRLNWSHATLNAVQVNTTNLKAGSRDINDFCPMYSKATDEQKINFWAYLISAISKYESEFDSKKRKIHENNSNDPATQLPRYREGLMHVSYADSLIYKNCRFNWNADSQLLPTNPKKTIFDPIKNIQCGVAILDQQLASHSRISTDRGSYWESLNPNSKNKKIKEISDLTKALSFCQ